MVGIIITIRHSVTIHVPRGCMQPLGLVWRSCMWLLHLLHTNTYVVHPRDLELCYLWLLHEVQGGNH